MSRTKRAVAVTFFLSLAGLGSWFAAAAIRPDPFPVGAALPPLTFDDGSGPHRLTANGRRPLLVVWFRSSCIHCQYEFGVLDRSLPLLDGVQIYLFNGEQSPPLSRAQLAASWPALGAPGRVILASVRSSEFERAFGTRLTPAMFAFDARGRLVKKVIGETKVDRVSIH